MELKSFFIIGLLNSSDAILGESDLASGDRLSVSCSSFGHDLFPECQSPQNGSHHSQLDAFMNYFE
jgi:hypothetical protein